MTDDPSEKTFCEFFAGIGLVDEALRRSGWHCRYANDIDAKKRQMYEGHYGPSPHYHEGDVWQVDQVLARIPGRPFLATASFPCTDMSLAGKRRGLAGEQSGSLFGFLQVIEQLGDRRPRALLLENVPGFLTSHDGEDFATAIHALAELGYWVDSFVIDAQWFVPQSRPRMFLVGYQSELLTPPLVVRAADVELGAVDDPWQKAIDRADRLRPARLRGAMETIEPATGWATIDCGNPRRSPQSISDVIDFGDDQPWWNQTEVDRHSAMMFDRHSRQVELLRAHGGPPLALTAFRRVREGKQRMEVRFDGVAGCLRTPRGGSAKQIVLAIVDGELRMRWMTPREYARLQGAGDYALPTNTIQALFGFGDAVCVPVIEWIDRHMLTPVFEGSKRGVRSQRSGAINCPAAVT
ncbi:DNA cytosine methyltransferase [Lacipirellula limnantheis]|uniref:DNA (cytosine-5-)-methyltransferase n=1 Tax=Lacipirellula limnantheis TaxID=2528024 RepID=A0A517TT93_9BACT|nr:DNA (cytosine-5-)-methyltransferase [Lacipirellula limnantheis]QDT71583.1 Modification methylase HpaII [Lacipirellula limnantheis]